MKKRILIFLAAIVIITLLVFVFYFNNTNLVNEKTVSYYTQLKDTLRSRGFSPKVLVISTKRIKWHNNIQVRFSGAATKSKHLSGDAIDFLVFDVNRDGASDSKDVDLVYEILDKEIIKGDGGIGTYKNEKSFINRQMIHIDCRGTHARWER